MSSQLATLASAVFPTLHATGARRIGVGSKKNQGCTLDAALIACDSSAAGQGSPAFSEPPAPRSHRLGVQLPQARGTSQARRSRCRLQESSAS
jgi:hypothetical protein